ncbi:MAG: F0F1 ATP synthase subunit B [Anaerolineae bacterium]|nr:F0F1 ATP synthase subunit B [Anaerolineae bacterium]
MDKLGINGGFLLAQIVNFGLVAIVLWALAWKPLVAALEARREKIAKGLEDARAAELARANAERDAQKYIDEQRVSAQKLVEEGRSRGEDQAKSVLEEARREADAIRVKARQDAEEERNAMLAEVRAQVGQIAIAAAERVIGQSLDEKKSQAIVNDFFTQVPAAAANLGATLEVVSAMPLGDAERAQIASKTGAKNISYKVDPSILGGLIIRSGDKVVDGSVRSNLNKLAATIS